MSRRAAKPLIRRARANADVAEAIDHYLTASTTVALHFIDAMAAAHEHVRRTVPRRRRADPQSSLLSLDLPPE